MLQKLKNFACRVVSRPSSQPHLALWCVGIVRNEIDIIDSWMSHLECIFDRVIMYDHLSIDGTRERLHEIAVASVGVTVRHCDVPENSQARLMTEAFKEIASEREAGWVFFMDADEFLLSHDADGIRRDLGARSAATSVLFDWLNAYPVGGAEAISRSTFIGGWRRDRRNLRRTKVAINLAHADRVASVNRGNHTVVFSDKPVFRKELVGSFLHLPIRTGAQLKRKVENGLAANALSPNIGDVSAHWHLLNKMGISESLEQSEAALRLAAFNYGRPPKEGKPVAPLPAEDDFRLPLDELVSLPGAG